VFYVLLPANFVQEQRLSIVSLYGKVSLALNIHDHIPLLSTFIYFVCHKHGGQHWLRWSDMNMISCWTSCGCGTQAWAANRVEKRSGKASWSPSCL